MLDANFTAFVGGKTWIFDYLLKGVCPKKLFEARYVYRNHV